MGWLLFRSVGISTASGDLGCKHEKTILFRRVCVGVFPFRQRAIFVVRRFSVLLFAYRATRDPCVDTRLQSVFPLCLDGQSYA